MTVHLKVRVDPDEFGLPGNRHHCAIANALMLADNDLVNVRVDEDNIRFSRRSTGTRFEFVTPGNAAAFIREFDKLVAAPDGAGKVRKMTAQPFTLVLRDTALIREVPRRARSAGYAIKRAAAKVYPELAPQPVAKVTRAVTVQPGGAIDKLPPPRKRATPVPRKRPSQRVA